MKVVKKILVAVAIAVLLGIVSIVAAGVLIPAERSFVNEIEIAAPAEKVWEVINDRERYTQWQTNLSRVEALDERTWVEYPNDSPEPLKFSLVKDSRPSAMVFRYSMGDSMHGTWSGEISPAATGVTLRTTDGYVTQGWITKILIYLFFDMDKFAKDWNTRLKQRAESLK